MTRYFMSVSEAVSLVIQAAALTEGGDLFMLDMGQRIRIDVLARRLIRLRGLRPWPPSPLEGGQPPTSGAGGYIPIVYTGVRPGEKLHEELIGDGEIREPTVHPHIFRVRCNHISDRAALRRQTDELIALAEAQRNGELVQRLRELVGG